MYQVKTEDEIIAAVQKARAKNSSTFGLLLDKEFFERCKITSSSKDLALLKGGLFSYSVAYNDDNMCACWYQQCKYKTLSFITGTLDSASAQKALAAGINGEEAFVFITDAYSWKLALQDKEYLSEWSARAGLRSSCIRRDEIKAYIFGVDNDAFYPAVRILSSVKNGTEDQLPKNYKKTLDIARKLMENVSGSDFEMFQQIHDILCEKIIYEINPKCEDNGSCVGALLNGKAKCDGYSDAFYLCCGLKKLKAAYQAGKSKVQRKYTEEDNHMWNLIYLDGMWRGVDVTWDGGGDDTTHDFFNIGLDRMRPAYSFFDAMLPKNMADKTSQFERVDQEYQVKSGDDILEAFKKMAAFNKEKITLRCSEKLYNKFLRDGSIL